MAAAKQDRDERRESPELSGRLATFSIGDLLQWAAQDRRSGALVVRRSRREKRVYLQGGRVVACLSDQPAEHFGEHLVLRGHLGEPQLVEALAHCSRTGERLPEGLDRLGLLPPETVEEALAERIHDVVCDLFLWPRGVFYFEAGRPPQGETLERPLEAMGLVLEGTRWIDEHARIRKVLPHDGVVLHRGPSWPPSKPSPLEERMRRCLGDGRTLEELHREVRGSYFRFLEAMLRLCLEEVLDIAEVGEPSATETIDLSVADLLLEQASEEERAELSRRRLGVPLDLLERLHPCWVEEPSEEELAELPEPLARLASELDGESPLGALLDERREVEERQLDYLQLELRRGRLALLPGSPEELRRAVGQEVGTREAREPLPRRWWRRIVGG